MSMRTLIPALGTILAATMALSTAAAPPTEAPALGTIVARIAGPDDSGWDYASVDPRAGRLAVARGSSVTLVDLASGAVRSVGTIAHGHAAIPVPDRGLLLVTSGRDDSVRLVDAASGRETARIAVGSDPDAALYDPATGHAVVMNAKAGTVSVLDVASARVIRTIALKPGLEFGVLAPGNRLFVNNEDAGEIESADLSTGAVAAPIAMPGCEGPSGLGLDAAGGRLVSACANGKAAVVDIAQGRLIGLIPIGRGPDAVIVDAVRGRAYIPCGGDGTLHVLAIGAGHPVRSLGVIATEPGARTGAVDPRDGRVYLPTARLGPPAKPGGRPTAIPGTFHILVMAPPQG